MKGGVDKADMTLSEGSWLKGFNNDILQSDGLPDDTAVGSTEGGSTPMTTCGVKQNDQKRSAAEPLYTISSR